MNLIKDLPILIIVMVIVYWVVHIAGGEYERQITEREAYTYECVLYYFNGSEKKINIYTNDNYHESAYIIGHDGVRYAVANFHGVSCKPIEKKFTRNQE